MYQNLDSFGARKLTGRFAIETDEELGASSTETTITA